MKITWLGQAGLLIERGGVHIMVDPYLSNSVVKVNPANFRRVPADQRFFEFTPDVMRFTHDQLDHYDPETAPIFFDKTEKMMTVLSPASVWQKARTNGGGHNYVMFDRGTEWSEYGFRFTAVLAVHSDPYAIGVIIEDTVEQKRIYIAGDTLYSERIFDDICGGIDGLFLPVNGVGNNMNMVDAARFAARADAKKVIPYHYGMFDEIDISEFKCDNAVIADIYREMYI